MHFRPSIALHQSLRTRHLKPTNKYSDRNYIMKLTEGTLYFYRYAPIFTMLLQFPVFKQSVLCRNCKSTTTIGFVKENKRLLKPHVTSNYNNKMSRGVY